jgi:hypothetical protein
VEAITNWELNISTRIHLSSAGDSTAFNVRDGAFQSGNESAYAVQTTNGKGAGRFRRVLKIQIN